MPRSLWPEVSGKPRLFISAIENSQHSSLDITPWPQKTQNSASHASPINPINVQLTGLSGSRNLERPRI
ncbi:uncharacterized protein ARMOST_07827 [Armillaria ostoyae]|uniref:Uncharacterized protein n=1 Tax=Armillaria ostoyae TaxID=47428 RepID=A0A284R6V0_ARMOS|nr:uncharacterized protein ARMOST_07827 [Armillaria ostoyae]